MEIKFKEPITTNVCCVYHSADVDGLTSGYLLRLLFPNAKMVGYNYGENLQNLIRKQNAIDCELFVFGDITPTDDFLYSIKERNQKVIIYDHHVDRISEIEKTFLTYDESNKFYHKNLLIRKNHLDSAASIIFQKYSSKYYDIFGDSFTNKLAFHVRNVSLYDTWNFTKETDAEDIFKYILFFQQYREFDEYTEVLDAYLLQKRFITKQGYSINVTQHDIMNIADTYLYENLLNNAIKTVNDSIVIHRKHKDINYAFMFFVGHSNWVLERYVCNNYLPHNDELKKDMMIIIPISFTDIDKSHNCKCSVRFWLKNELATLGYDMLKNTDLTPKNIAKIFNGGGHEFASGFVKDFSNFQTMSECSENIMIDIDKYLETK